MYNLGYFKMPDPVGLKDDNEWLEIPRISKTVPFGFKTHKTDKVEVTTPNGIMILPPKNTHAA